MAPKVKSEPLNKEGLISEIFNTTGDLASRAATTRVVDTALDKIREALVEGREVSLPGLGKFKVKEQKARQGRNPSTGETMTIPARRVVKFSVAAPLKKDVAR